MALVSKRIIIDFIPQHEQFVPSQVGDYGETEEVIWFKITKLSGLRSIYVLIHEIWEKFLNNRDGISDDVVTRFDWDHPEIDDPGMSPEAPYHANHLQGDVLERTCCVMAGDDFVEYEKEINSLFE